ncbi:MAG: insulinase family protein [Chitinispirillaceae bacterium]|nr:insulinase family protein [Chitinispirillaceae bacterium]
MTVNKPPAQKIQRNTTLHGFHVDRIQPIPELRTTAYLFTHGKSRARVLHLFNDDPENLFCIAFRTPVRDNTGVPHIMEHSVLGGSQKFPVKDPFQEMLKGSLQTFLNALTYRDKTVYPVASQVEKDFFNLVDVYCDAVFNPLLSEYTLYQEGWHFEVKDVAGPVSIKGIVYNEMKGVFSDFSSHVARHTMAGLMPDTIYSFESGGEPEHIPELTYERFRNFHRRFYHPSNSYIVLYGNCASRKTLRFLDENYLGAQSAIEPDSAITPQPLWRSPRSLTVEAPAPKEDNGNATILLSWIFDKSCDPFAMLAGTVLSHYLLGTESSPLKRALIDSGLGQDLDDVSGFSVEAIQTTFTAGLRKSKPRHAGAVEKIILDTLALQADKGLDPDLLQGALRQVEFHLREIGGGGLPYHLRLADRCYNSWLYDGDPCAHLAFEKPLASLKRSMAGRGDLPFREIIRNKLLDNMHRLQTTVIASSDKGKELEKQSEQQAAALSASFTAEDRQKHAAITEALTKRQAAPASPEALATLPYLTKADLPLKGFDVPCTVTAIGAVPVYCHPIFTSGIVYLDIGFDCRPLPADLIPYVPLYLELLRRCGAGAYSYEEMATRITLSTGGIGTSAVCRATTGADDDQVFRSFIHGKALRSRFREMLAIFSDLLLRPNLSHIKQVRDILIEARNSLNASVVRNGHHIAMLLAGARLSPSRHIEETLSGISQLRFLERTINDNALDETIARLEQVHRTMVTSKGCVVSMTADNPDPLVEQELSSFLNELPSREINGRTEVSPVVKTGQFLGVEINSAVNFSARSWRLGPFSSDQYGLLFLLARHLSTGYLWDKIRVMGGAYGGMAIMALGHPLFTCASYRDPNLGATLRHFERSLRETAAEVDAGVLEKSIIGAIGRIDQPVPPHARGFGETLDRLCNYTQEKRKAVRASILSATAGSLRRAAASVLDTTEWAIATLGNAAAFDSVEKEGFMFQREPLLNEK